MSATIPLPVRAESRVHELFARAWALQPTTTTRQRGARAVLLACGARLRDAWAAWRRRLASRATRRALLNLDDRTLRDIGFVRAEVESVAAELHGGVAVTRARLLMEVGPFVH